MFERSSRANPRLSARPLQRTVELCRARRDPGPRRLEPPRPNNRPTCPAARRRLRLRRAVPQRPRPPSGNRPRPRRGPGIGMIATMRRLHARGSESRGVVVDRDGAMLGPDCVLVRRTQSGFRCLAPEEAAAIQAAILGPDREPGWLFDQTRRIADALAKGELALAQIHGLRIPITDLDEASLRWLAGAAPVIKANFNPDQPRVPKGEPGAGQWLYLPGYAKPPTHGDGSDASDDDGNTVSSDPAPASGSSDRKPPPETGGGDPPRIP